MRMSREQINTSYPNQWVGIRDVQYENGTRHIMSADVVYTDRTASEIAEMTIRGEDIQPLFTTPDSCFPLGFQIGSANRYAYRQNRLSPNHRYR